MKTYISDDQSILDRICRRCLFGESIKPAEINEALSCLDTSDWDHYCEIHDRDTFSGNVVYGLECYEIRSTQGESVWVGVLFDAASDDDVDEDEIWAGLSGREKDGEKRKITKNRDSASLSWCPLPTIHTCFSELLSCHDQIHHSHSEIPTIR